MNKRTVVLFAAVLSLNAWVSRAAGPDFEDNFDGYGVGQTFTGSPVNGWQASSNSVMVTNNVYQSQPNSVMVPRQATLTNVVNGGGDKVIWTDCYLRPVPGHLPSDLPLNTASLVAYFNPSGYVQVATASGWVTCSNDVWGGAIGRSGADFTRVSVYQNYSTSNSAVFVDGHLAIQNLRFVGSASTYNTFSVMSPSSNSWMDSVWIKTNYDATTLTNDFNANGVADAEEMASYGYAGLFLYVGSGAGLPHYGSFQAAVDTARSHDVVYVYGENYAESLVLSNAVTIGGSAFTNSGTLTIKIGASPLFRNEMSWGSVNLETNADTTFSQSLTCSNLTVQSGATGTFQSVTCTNLTVEENVQLTLLGSLHVVNSSILGQNTIAGFTNAVTCGTGFTAGTNSTAIFAQSLSCSSLVVRAGATVVCQSLTCSNLVVEAGAHFNCLGSFACSGSSVIDENAICTFAGTVACPGVFDVAAGATVTLGQGASLGLLACTGTVTLADGKSLTVVSATVPGAVYVSAGGTATVTTALSVLGGGHLDFTQGRFLYSPMAVDMSGTFSISNNWGAGNSISVSANANSTFNQALNCNTLTVNSGAASTFQAVTSTNLTTEEGVQLTFRGDLHVVNGVVIGQDSEAGFSNAVSCGAGFEVGANSTAIFSQSLTCSSLVVRAGASVVCQSLTCSNLVVEAGAHFTCLGAFQCGDACSIGANATVTFSGAVTCSGAFTVNSGATVTLEQGATLGSLNAGGLVVVGAGQSLTVGSAIVSGGVQVTGSGTMTVDGSLNVTGSGLMTFTDSRLVVPADNADMNGTFTVNNTWGQPSATMELPFVDDFERYTVGTRITDIGFSGWGATATNVVIQSGEANLVFGGSKGLSIPRATVVSNRITTAARKIWTDCYLMPNLGKAPFNPPTNTAGFVAFVNTNGWLEVAIPGGWDVCSNLVSGSGQPDRMTTSTWTRVTVCQNLTNDTLAIFINGKLVRQLLTAPGVQSGEYKSFIVNNPDGQAYLDDVSIKETWPETVDLDLDLDESPDAYEVDQVGSVTARNSWTRGSLYRIR